MKNYSGPICGSCVVSTQDIQQKQKIKITWIQEKLTGIATTVWLIEIIYTPNRSAEAQVEENSPTQGTIVIC